MHYIIRKEFYAGDITYMPSLPDKGAPIGEQLRYFRYKQGLTIDELAKHISVDAHTISHLELHDNRAFNIDWVNRYIAFLGCFNELELNGYIGFLLRNPATLIKEKRKTLGMTNQEFCVYVGVSDNTISRWEHGVIPSYRFWTILRRRFPEF